MTETTDPSQDTRGPVLIVGAGLAGLCCARVLQQAGVDLTLLDAADTCGGRVRTDVVDGYRLDRGFQVLLTAYPEARDVLDYQALDLRAFQPGALIRRDGRFHRFADPWRAPRHVLASLRAGVGRFADRLRVARLRAASIRANRSGIPAVAEQTTLDCLRGHYGFSEDMIDGFFRPFLGGVFLDAELQTTSHMLHFVFGMFSKGDAALPARGMEEIPAQLTNGLPPERIRLSSEVKSLDANDGSITLENGERLQGSVVVLATDAPAAHRLCPELPGPQPARSVTCLYYTCDSPPVDEPILILNGDGLGPVNNLSVPSVVSPHYSPSGRHLVSVSVLDRIDQEEASLDSEVRSQLSNWYGQQVNQWETLRIVRVPYALPSQPPGAAGSSTGRITDRLYVCGDYCENSSIQGAMVSGRAVAEQILQAGREE
ncbi:protoporphyrinogen oxidase [Maioricimonas rarisocia]|uniref:Protoporphyrinogen oxidase n=1 Tax=Maioricimonas rarisocia TaxID=2528026 RepID=A0A517ZC96_9PLAN|nr:NAD(P)/FAD-dependent oxidoreductase [Maioricimonas rarisocia]QDU40060.1 protoporphyrinogen oxidase [Maioricimonas rarisocia]